MLRCSYHSVDVTVFAITELPSAGSFCSWRNCLNCDFFDSVIPMIFRILVIYQSQESRFRRRAETGVPERGEK